MRTSSRVAIAIAAGLTILLAGAAPAMAADRNRNKIPDSWEKKYHLSTTKNQAKTDLDKDGLTAANEYLAGTNPRLKDTDRDGLKDGYEDRDKDGLVNLAEIKSKTSIKIKDTDGDGVLDSKEDPDADGLTNAQEWVCLTNPLKADTDGDGVSDAEGDLDDDSLMNAEEFIVKTHPRVADTDRDGTYDADEDYDHDGLDNYTEFGEGSDPTDPDSDDDGILDGAEIIGVVSAFDAETGAISVSSLRQDAALHQFVVNADTVLKWKAAEEGVEVPATDPTLEDLFEGTTVCDITTVEQPDGSLLVTSISIVVDEEATDPGEGELVAEVVSFDPDTSVLTLVDLTGDGETFDVTVDESTAFAWIEGSTVDHEAGADDLIEGTSVSALEVVVLENGSLVATQIELVPMEEALAE